MALQACSDASTSAATERQVGVGVLWMRNTSSSQISQSGDAYIYHGLLIFVKQGIVGVLLVCCVRPV